MGILLAIIAIFLLYILSPILIIYSLFRLHKFTKISDHFFDVAVSIDKLGNILGALMFNDIMITKDGFQFGADSETISSVIGRNYLTKTLRFTGRILRWALDKIQPNHCINAIGK